MKYSSYAVKSFISLGILSLGALASPVANTLRSNGNVDVERRLDDNDVDANCIEHEIDFVVLEGDAVRTAVEDDIVAMLKKVGIKVNTRLLQKDDFNAAEKAGDFHLSFSETWGAPYDPHAFAAGWVAGDEGHRIALAGLEPPGRAALFAQIDDVLKEENHVRRGEQWEDILKVVHDNYVQLPLWGARVPTVLNNRRLTNFRAGYQQFDYPVHRLEVAEGTSTTVTIAPAGQTGLFASVGRMDPHTYRPNEFFSNNWVYEGLVSYYPFSKDLVLPALAASWTVVDEGEGQKYTFQLRPDVTFHDGAVWNCAAAKLNFDHVLAAPLRTADYHGWYGLMAQIKTWECAADLELVVTTADRYYPFLQELSFIRPLRMLSPNAFADGPASDPLAANSCHVGWGTIEADGTKVVCAGTVAVAGTGPFRLDSREPGAVEGEDERVVFAANSNYWDGAPSIETLVVQRYDDSAAVATALKDGSLDLVWGSGVLSPRQLVDLDADENNDLDVFYSDDIQNVMLLLNTGKAPLDDINVRKTIVHAVDKRAIIDKELGGIVKQVDNVFPIDAPYCNFVLTPRLDYDLEKARFLNCPAPDKSRSVALGLGLGLGGACIVLLAVAAVYVRKSKVLATELALKENAVKA